MKKTLSFIVIFMCIFFAQSRAQKAQDVNINAFKYYTPNGVELLQTKNGLTIELTPISADQTMKFPELFSWNMEAMPKAWQTNLLGYFIQRPDGKYYGYTFGAGNDVLNVYKLKITNNTGHIIKMSDARILLRIEGEDPIKPYTKVGDATLVAYGESQTLLPKSYIDKDGSLIDWETTTMANWDKNRKKPSFSMEYPIGLASQIIAVNRKAYKLINDVDVEILPDDSYSGLLLFPRVISDNEVNVRMYEFITKTDAAGNVVEKSNFDFKLKLAEGKQWFDQNQKKWVDGEPPAKTEYYDKKNKTWIMGTPPAK